MLYHDHDQSADDRSEQAERVVDVTAPLRLHTTVALFPTTTSDSSSTLLMQTAKAGPQGEVQYPQQAFTTAHSPYQQHRGEQRMVDDTSVAATTAKRRPSAAAAVDRCPDNEAASLQAPIANMATMNRSRVTSWQALRESREARWAEEEAIASNYAAEAWSIWQEQGKARAVAVQSLVEELRLPSSNANQCLPDDGVTVP